MLVVHDHVSLTAACAPTFAAYLESSNPFENTAHCAARFSSGSSADSLFASFSSLSSSWHTKDVNDTRVSDILGIILQQCLTSVVHSQPAVWQPAELSLSRIHLRLSRSGSGTARTSTLVSDRLRLQLQGELQAKKDAPKMYRGVFHGIKVIGQNEGIRGLFRGIGCAVSKLRSLRRPSKLTCAVHISGHSQRLSFRIL